MKTSRNLLLAALLCGSSILAFAGAAANGPTAASVSDCWIRALPGRSCHRAAISRQAIAATNRSISSA